MFLAAGLSVFALAGGCGQPDSTQGGQDLASFVIVQDLSKVFVCVSSCSNNDECVNSCPSPASGTSCCDTTTHQCFTSQSNVCPAPADLSVVSPY